MTPPLRPSCHARAPLRQAWSLASTLDRLSRSCPFGGVSAIPVIVDLLEPELSIKRQGRFVVGGDLKVGRSRSLLRRIREQRPHDRGAQTLPPVRRRGVQREQA